MRNIDAKIEEWVRGSCYVAAVELHRLTGWPLGGLTAVRSSSRGPQMAHAWVVDPDGQAWDAGGPLSMEEVHEDFIASQPRPLANIRYESFADEAAFMDRHRELAGDWWPDCPDWFASRQPGAEVAMQEHVLPKWERLAQAAARRQVDELDSVF